jgi:UDP-N-acetylglucosamine 4-epimerase
LHPKFELIEGDIRNIDDCMKVCKGIDAISHQVALGSVPRSIAEPLTSHQVNVNGFINILETARANNIKRIVYASSSVYVDLQESPKVENRVGKVLSLYAATKMTNELYAEAYAKNYDMTLYGFRYFNVFGPKQDPEGPYAAVIPLFIKSALTNTSPTINGDGTRIRDFTPVSNVTPPHLSDNRN